jgi:T4-like virus tail tube protein gp19
MSVPGAADSGFSITNFLSQGLTLGGARPALFNVQFPVLPGYIGIDASTISKLSFTCRASALPAATVGIVEVPYFGRKIKLHGDRTFADWNITVINDEDFLVRAGFEMWNNALNELQSNVENPGNEPLDQYKVDALIAQFGKAGQVIRRYKMIGAWPAAVEAIEVDWESQNQIETFRVTLAYDYWLPDFEQAPNVYLPNT